MKFFGNPQRDMADNVRRMVRFADQPTFRMVNLEVTNAAPAITNEGDIYYADGTNWNPGAGAGAYIYRGAAWHLLG